MTPTLDRACWALDNTPAGRLMKALVAWTNYNVGMGTSFLEDVKAPLPHLEAKWIQALRNYLTKINEWLHIDDAGILPLEREHDCYIMDQCLQSKLFKPASIRVINYCRMFLGAVALSDLTNTAGDCLLGHLRHTGVSGVKLTNYGANRMRRSSSLWVDGCKIIAHVGFSVGRTSIQAIWQFDAARNISCFMSIRSPRAIQSPLPKFIQHLSSLEPWEFYLLQHVCLSLDPLYTCFNLHQHFCGY